VGVLNGGIDPPPLPGVPVWAVGVRWYGRPSSSVDSNPPSAAASVAMRSLVAGAMRAGLRPRLFKTAAVAANLRPSPSASIACTAKSSTASVWAAPGENVSVSPYDVPSLIRVSVTCGDVIEMSACSSFRNPPKCGC